MDTIFQTLWVLLAIVQIALSLERSFTVNVEPQKEDCFYQTLETGTNMHIEYQVISGGHGDLDISFNMAEPMGRIMVADFKKGEKSHTIEVKIRGDYKICFDNTFSSFNTKTVYFAITVYSASDDQWNDNLDINFDTSNLNIENQQIEGLHEVLNTVRTYLNKARELQDLIKTSEAKDRNTVEELFFKVNTYSLLILVVMIFVSFIQILMVKSIFDSNSTMYKVLCYLDIKNK